MIDAEEAKKLVKRVQNEVQSDATQSRLSRTIKLVLESFSYEHVFTELLQNADDCCDTTTATIEVTDNAVFFTHNGKPFDEKDLKAICDIGVSTKKPGAHIGFMGIGFKAAFKLSDAPQIYSGSLKFSFSREDVIVPRWIDDVPPEVAKRLDQKKTLIYLPFRTNFPNDIIASFINLLNSTFEPVCLVFLRRIRELRIVNKDRERILKKKTARRKNYRIIETNGDKSKSYDYCEFRKTVKITEAARSDPRARDSKRSELKTTDLSIVLSVKDGAFTQSVSTLYTFLPTPYNTGLRFVVNGDFLLNTQRTEPDWTSAWNRWLFSELSNAILQLARKMAKDRHQRLKLFELMPRKAEIAKDLAGLLYSPLINSLKDTEIVLNSANLLVKPVNIALASKEVQNVIPPEKAGVISYVHCNIKGRDFLRDDLSIKDLFSEKEEKKFVLDAIHDSRWLVSLNNPRIMRLYELLFQKAISTDDVNRWDLDWQERNSLMEDIKKQRLIKCLDGTLQLPNETILPTRKRVKSELLDLPCIHIVDKAILSKHTTPFLNEVGVQTFSEDALASRILQSHEKDEPILWTEKQRYDCIIFFSKYLKRRDPIPDAVKEKLGYLLIPVNGEKWEHSKDCYLQDSQLEKLLPNANYVDLQKLTFLLKAIKFLRRLGVISFPRVITHSNGYYYQAPDGMELNRWNGYWGWLRENDYITYEGYGHEIEKCFELSGFDQKGAIDPGNNKLFLKYLIEHWEEYYKSYLRNTFNWNYYRSRSKDVPSYIAYQLKANEWLPTTEGLKVPSEAFLPSKENKVLAGNIVPFVELDNEQLKKSNSFCDYIGVTTKLNINSLYQILEKASSLTATNELRKQLELLYERIYIEISRLPPDSVRTQYDWHLLERIGKFSGVSKLYWIDDPELEEQFGDTVQAAWIPSNLSRPQLERLFDFFGLTRLTSVLRREITDDLKTDFDKSWTQKIKKTGDYIYSILLHFRSGKVEFFSDFIQNLKVLTTEKLVLKLTVPSIEKISTCSCFCDISKQTLFVCISANEEQIAREIARAFEAPLDSAFAIEMALADKDQRKVENKLAMSSIQVLHLSLSQTMPKVEEKIEEPNAVTLFGARELIEQTNENLRNPGEERNTLNTNPVLSTIIKDANLTQKIENDSQEIKIPEVTIGLDTIGNKNSEKIDQQEPQADNLQSLGESSTELNGTNEQIKYVGPRPTTGIDHKPFEIEEKARIKVVEYETQVEKRMVINVLNWANLGYDIISKGADGTIRYIEIKGSSEDFDELGITQSQLDAAKTYRDQYFIYRVAFTATNPVIYAIQDPFPELEKGAELIQSYRVRQWSTLFGHKMKSLTFGSPNNQSATH